MGERTGLGISTNAILIAVTIAACIGYLLLLFLGHNERQRFQTRIHSLEQSQNTLERELDSNKYSLKRAQDSLTTTEEARARLESQLFDLQSRNWQEKFETAQREYLELHQNRLYDDAEISRLQRSLAFLQQQNKQLQADLETAHAESQTLQAELAVAEDTRKKMQREFEKDLNRQKIALEELSIQTETNRQNKVTAPSAGSDKPDTDNQAPNVDLKVSDLTPAEPDNKNDSQIYRLVRLQSVSNAMQGKPSATRRVILLNVIPTVPGGVSGEELLTLTTGMDSSDILIVIQNTGGHLIRPVGQKTIETLIAGMNESDGQTATALLAEQH